MERWRENGSLIVRDGRQPQPVDNPVELRAIVGHAGLEPFVIDLRRDGPHALVGGTTGAGKSEFLQAWVLGLAHALSPDRVNYLFVDYKGGSAFAKCVELPHCVGLVTDLNPYLVRRVLTGLRAELKRREHLLNDKGKKVFADRKIKTRDQFTDVEDLVFADQKSLSDAGGRCDLYDLAKLLCSLDDEALRQKLLACLARSKREEVQQDMASMGAVDPMEVLQTGRALVAAVREKMLAKRPG